MVTQSEVKERKTEEKKKKKPKACIYLPFPEWEICKVKVAVIVFPNVMNSENITKRAK